MSALEHAPAGAPGMAGMRPAWRIGTSFQPLFGVHSAALAGYEALARPVNPVGEAVAPADYFASHAGADLTRVDRECRRAHLSRFAALDDGVGFLYLNVHPRALLADVATDLRGEFARHGIAPARVCLEILEDECGDEGLLAEVAIACREAGIRVAMDDFGIARSNFDRLAAVQPDFVKIDRSLLNEAVGCAKARRVLPSVIRMLHDAGTEVVVEGIEEAAEALCAIESGADYLQGHYFGTPRPSLSPDPMATDLICKLKKIAGTCVRDPAGCDDPTANSCLARLLAAGRAMGMAD